MIRQADSAEVRFKLFANTASGAGSVPETWLDRDNVEILNPRVPNRALNASVFATRRPRLDKLMGDIDALWSPNVLFLSVSDDVPLALTVHDLSFLIFPETFSRKRRWWHKAVRAVELMKRADVLFAVSETTRRDLVALLDIPEEKIRVVPHGVMPISKTETMPDSWLMSSETPFVLFLSTLEPRKNVLGLLKAFEDVMKKERREEHLVLAGEWGWSSGPLREAIRRSPFSDRVHVLGYVSEEEKAWLLRRARVLAFPSLYEGFGLPPLEAFQADLPVLTSSTSAVAETVGDAAVLANPYDVGEIAYGLGELLKDETLRDELAARGRKRLEAFSWERSADIALDALCSTKRSR